MVTEADFQTAVIGVAHLGGWRVAHFRPARTADGWRTAVAADGAGFPDLVLVRRDELLFAELKSARGALRSTQEVWLDALAAAGVEVHVWRPTDMPSLTDRLLRKDRAA